MVLHWRLFLNWRSKHNDSHLLYITKLILQLQATVKFHGVFASHWNSLASTPVTCVQGILCRDSGDLVIPFMRVVIQTTRYFATLREL